ncbi:peptidase S8/S53 domain-containing protein [Cytidiella melzeri]|nr:peptidase S8/S53 domain-containing protein [Cytidiella melzeri]
MRSACLLAAALLPFAVAKPFASKRWADYEVKHAWNDVPQGWKCHGPAPSDHLLDMRIALKQDKFEDLVTALYEVSDPEHHMYGQHLTKEQVDALVAPHSDSVELVNEWLEAHGVAASSAQRTNGGSWLRLPVTVEQASRMLNATYEIYHHDGTSESIVRTLSYSLPADLHAHVRVITPTTYFGTMRSMRKTSFLQPQIKPIDNDIETAAQLTGPGSLATVPSSCATTITPACLRALYNTTTYVPKATNVNKLGVAGYLEEFANNADLQTFFSKFRTDAEGATFQTVQVNGGGNDQTDPGVEANLDIQYTEGMSFPTPNIYYSTGGSPPFTPDSETPTNTNEPYLDWLNFILAQSSVPLDYATEVCNLFAQLGARGSSIMFSSGDDGVGGGTCVTNDGKNTKRFQPNFPASCPFVTTVGATTRINPEVAISFSGGGFSNYFARPSYQSSAVTTFLTRLGTTDSGLFNTTGRAYPDVAAQGQGFQVVIGGRTESVAGTSASSPTFAGVIALLNDFRLSQNKSALGFLNPILYSTGVAGFNDITSGSNPGCGTNGFTAGTGWDPVTGLGTPDFGKLQSLIGST